MFGDNVEQSRTFGIDVRVELGQPPAWQSAEAGPSRPPIGLGRWLVLFVLFSIAAVVQTWPLARHFSGRIVDWWFFPFDGWYYLWSLWWIKHALVVLHTNPFHSDLLLYPQGVDLHLQLPVITGLLSIPLQLVTGNLILTSNILALLYLVLSGLAMYALAYKVTSNHSAALLAGYVFAFAPFIIMHAAGHWNISGTWPIPLFVLFLLRFQESGRLRDAVIAGVVWAALIYNWVEFGTDAGVFLALFVLYWSFVYLRRKERESLKGLWRGTIVIGVVAFVLSAPLVIPSLISIYGGDILFPGGDDIYSADLVSFVTPSPLWGPIEGFSAGELFGLNYDGTSPLAGGPNPNHVPTGGIENTMYLGFVPLILAGLAMLRVRQRPHQVLIWLGAFLLFGILSLGPNLWISDSKDFNLLGLSFSIPLPYQLYDQLPVLGQRRIPSRIIVFALMAMAVLSAVGLDILTGWLRGGRRLQRLVPVVAVLALAIVVLEYWNPPVYLTNFTIAPVFDEIAAEPGDFTVLHAPLGRRNGQSYDGDITGGPITDFYQTLHHKASFGGYVSRTRTTAFEWLHQEPGIRVLACATCPDPPSGEDLDPQVVRRVFREYRIRYVVLHRLGPDGYGLSFIGERELKPLEAYIQDVIGLKPVYSDAILTIYWNPQVGPASTISSESVAQR